jgi:hypothetical protein
MINQEATVKKTVNNLYSGEVVTAGYKRGERDFTDSNRFVGFKIGDQVYSNLKLAKQAFGVRNLRDLEFEIDRLELGTFTAEFFDVEDKYFWAAYLWNGGFKVGTSADALKLAN